MAFEHEQREALRILEGIESGLMSTRESWTLIEQADPTLVYFIITWLRERYAKDPAAEAVLGRIVAIFKEHPSAAQIMKTGEDDAIVTWFESEYSYGDFSSEEFVRLVVEKLEG